MSSYIQVIGGEIHVVIPLNGQVDTIWESSLV